MPRLYLVRHGEAAAGFGDHHDPSLSALGREQALATAKRLSAMTPVDLISSPLARARETAAPLEALWQQVARIEPAVAEIPSPTEDLEARTNWLRGVMAGNWDQAGAPSIAWRNQVIACLCALPRDTIVFSHFVAINVAVGHALGDDRVTCFIPDNASVTVVESDGQRLTLIEKGQERATIIR
jgi:broad specificity phosphatase PhoE